MSCRINSISIEFEENCYAYSGTRARVGTMEMVVIDIKHPNYGYFAEFMAFWRSPHFPDWESIHIHRGSLNFGTPEDLVNGFPGLHACLGTRNKMHDPREVLRPFLVKVGIPVDDAYMVALDWGIGQMEADWNDEGDLVDCLKEEYGASEYIAEKAAKIIIRMNIGRT